MSRRDERAYYVWRAHMEGAPDCYVVSSSKDHDDCVDVFGGLDGAVKFIWDDIRAMPADKSQSMNFVVKTISNPDIILHPRAVHGQYRSHGMMCRWPLPVDEMIKLSDLIYQKLSDARRTAPSPSNS